MYVCICNAVTESEIRQAVELGARSMRDLKEGLGVSAGCGRCTSCAKSVLREAKREKSCTSSASCAGGFSMQAG